MVGVACVTPHAPPLSYPTPSVNPPLPPSRPSSHPPPLGPAASQSSSCRPKALRHPSQHTLRLACMQTTSLVCPVVLRRADGPLLAAVRSGAWVLLDELNLAGQTVLEGLNAVLDHRAEVGRAGGAGGRGGGGGQRLEGRWPGGLNHTGRRQAWPRRLARLPGMCCSGRACLPSVLCSGYADRHPPSPSWTPLPSPAGVHPRAEPHLPLPAHLPSVWGAEPAAGRAGQGRAGQQRGA